MNLPSLVKFEHVIMPGGKLFVNTSLIKEAPTRSDLDIYNVDANEIASGLQNSKVSNMVILGAIISKTGVVKRESVEKSMEKLFTGDKAGLLPLNKQALTAWKG